MSSEFYDLALEKTGRVLGKERGEALVRSLLEKHKFEIQTPQDLKRLSVLMGELGGIEGALGTLLGVVAVLRGAQ